MTDVELPADDAALEELLRERRFGPPDPDEATPWDFARRWPNAVVSARVWPVVSRLLVDDDATVRARAIEFVRDWRDGADATTPRLLEIAERRAPLFGAQIVDRMPLRELLAHALANRARGDVAPRIATALKRLVTDAPVGGGAAAVLGLYEPEFVVTQVRHWGDDAADWVEEAAQPLAMFRRDSVVPLLQALGRMSAPIRERILAAVESSIQRDDARASTFARNRGVAAPAKPAPSSEQCRRAAGL